MSSIIGDQEYGDPEEHWCVEIYGDNDELLWEGVVIGEDEMEAQDKAEKMSGLSPSEFTFEISVIAGYEEEDGEEFD